MATLIKSVRVLLLRRLSSTTSKQRFISKAGQDRKNDVSIKSLNNRKKITDNDSTVKTPLQKADLTGKRTVKNGFRMLTNDQSYEVLKGDDHKLGRTILQAKSKRGRSDLNEIIIEGENSIVDALQANGVIKALYFSSTDLLQKFPLQMLPTNIPLYKVPKFKLDLFTDLVTSPGILGIFEMPPEGKALKPPDHVLPVTLICNDIRDPSTLGHLLQSAAAVGCQRVILMKGCCDYWNSKVVRSSGLSQFYLSIMSDITWTQINSVLMMDRPLQVYLLRKERITPRMLQHYDGSESAFSRLQKIEEDETSEPCEYEEEDVQNDLQDLYIDYERKEEVPKEVIKWAEDDMFNNVNHLKEYKHAPLTLQCYDRADYTSGHSVIIVDESYSLQSKKFVYDSEGTVLHFQIASNLYGLPSSMAGSLALFEASKQFRNKVDEAGTEK